MKQLLILLIFNSSYVFAQCDSSDIILIPDVEAQFPGGNSKLIRLFQENMPYSIEADDIIDASKIHLEFIVCEDGTISNIKCKRPQNSALNEHYVSLVSKMPNWIPAEVNGKPVTSWCRIPITICFN